MNAYAILKYLQARLTGKQFRKLFFFAVATSAGLVFVAVVGLTYLGYIAPWSGRFYSLYDTGYALCCSNGMSCVTISCTSLRVGPRGFPKSSDWLLVDYI